MQFSAWGSWGRSDQTLQFSQGSWWPQRSSTISPTWWLRAPAIQAPVREQDQTHSRPVSITIQRHRTTLWKTALSPHHHGCLQIRSTWTTLDTHCAPPDCTLQRTHFLKIHIMDVLANIFSPNILNLSPWGSYWAPGSLQTQRYCHEGLCHHLGQGRVQHSPPAWRGLVFKSTNEWVICSHHRNTKVLWLCCLLDISEHLIATVDA